MIAAINMRRQRGRPCALLLYANLRRHERETASAGERERETASAAREGYVMQYFAQFSQFSSPCLCVHKCCRI